MPIQKRLFITACLLFLSILAYASYFVLADKRHRAEMLLRNPVPVPPFWTIYSQRQHTVAHLIESYVLHWLQSNCGSPATRRNLSTITLFRA